MAKLTLKKLATELNANNVSCSIGKNVDKIFLDEIKDGYMAYIFEGDNGFILVVRLRDTNNKALDHKTYTQEQNEQCNEYKKLLTEILNETEVYEFKSGKKKETVNKSIEKDNGDVSDTDLLNSDFFNEK